VLLPEVTETIQAFMRGEDVERLILLNAHKMLGY